VPDKGETVHLRHTTEDQLKSVPLFSSLGAKEMLAVHSLMTQTSVLSGHVLAREGAHGNEFIIILAGTASVDRGGSHVADVGPGDFLGEISLLDAGPRTATVTATAPMTIMVATNREFHAMLETTPSVAVQMLPALAHRVRALANDALTH
jgi:CRP/FNR family transcriptional regulator, cyclic AMP receptor protein